MTLQQLFYFVSACRYGNISRAAEKFSVSQPSVSSAIRALEKEFGTTLIRRRHNGFVLTEEGEEFRKLAESLVEHAFHVEEVMSSKGKKRHFVRLGVPPMIASVLFPTVYSRFRARHDDVEIFTQEMGREDLLAALDDGLLDLAFLPHTENFPSEYSAVPVADFETVCCVWSGHRLAGKKSVTAGELAGEDLILFSKSFFHTERIFSFFAAADAEPKVVHTSSQLSTVEEFVSREIAVGFLFRQIAEENKKIVPISLSPRLSSKISLILRKDHPISDGVERFASFVKELAEELRL